MGLNKNAGSKKTIAALTLGVACAATAVMLIASRKPAQPAGSTMTKTAVATSASNEWSDVTPATMPGQVALKNSDKATTKHEIPDVKDAPISATLNGCLERDGEDFRLKDTEGEKAPKARSWKSGFLKKGSPKIDVVDAGNRLKLKDHVGQRVTVSGMLSDREMQARSLKSVAPSCE
jgi:hypothetical protein